MQSLINKAFSLLSLTGSGGTSHAAWLRKFEEKGSKGERNDFQIKQLIRAGGIPDDLRRTIWPKLIRMHELTVELKQTNRRHSRSLSVTVNGKEFECFHLSERDQQHLKTFLLTFQGQVPPIMPVLLAFLIKYCDIDALDEYLGRLKPRGPGGEYFFYPAGRRDVLIFERVLEELLSKFSPAVMKRLANLQLLVPEYAPQWEKLLFSFFVGIYPLEISSRIFDCFLIEGYKVLLRFTLAHCLLRREALAKCTSPAGFEKELFRCKSNATDAFWHRLRDVAFDLNFSRDLVDRYRNRHRKLSDADLDAEDLRLLIQQTQKMPTLLQESAVCSDSEWGMIWRWIPARYRMLQLDVSYRKSIHGGSMSTLYALCGASEPLLVFVGTTGGVVVGAFLSKALSSRPMRKKFSSPFFGTGETFIFELGQAPCAHNWTAGTPNTNWICADEHFLGVGCSEGRFGLWIGDNLSRVSCSSCLTFNNSSLNLSETDVSEIEVFKFVA